MIKVEAIEDFTIERFDELHNLVRCTPRKGYKKIYKGDRFECNKIMVDYLLGNNPERKKVIKLIEVKTCKDKKKHDIIK